jgi:hypothetical protein
VIAAYPGMIKWAGVALERSFNLSYEQFDGQRDKQIEAYAFLRLMIRRYDTPQFQGENSSESLDRLRRRLPEVRIELGLTAAEQTEIDDELGIKKEDRNF